MRGTRDSEIAASIRDLDTVDSVMDGRPVKVKQRTKEGGGRGAERREGGKIAFSLLPSH